MNLNGIDSGTKLLIGVGVLAAVVVSTFLYFRKADRLCEGIHAFYAQYGHPPSRLNQLAPEYRKAAKSLGRDYKMSCSGQPVVCTVTKPGSGRNADWNYDCDPLPTQRDGIPDWAPDWARGPGGEKPAEPPPPPNPFR